MARFRGAKSCLVENNCSGVGTPKKTGCIRRGAHFSLELTMLQSTGTDSQSLIFWDYPAGKHAILVLVCLDSDLGPHPPSTSTFHTAACSPEAQACCHA